MIDELEALYAVALDGTMTRAASRLRITQSAVSKRIAALAERVGAPLVEPDGRRIRLTEVGHAIVENTRPIVAELRSAVTGPEIVTSTRALTIGVSESVLSTWGAKALHELTQTLDVNLTVAAHRSMVAIERVRSGEYHVALCAGLLSGVSDLSQEELRHEPFVLVPRADEPLVFADAIDVITIEPAAASGKGLPGKLRHLKQKHGIDLRISRTVQSFMCVGQMAIAGFAVGLVPEPIAQTLGCDYQRLPGSGITRPISLFARARTMSQPLVQSLITQLRE